MKFVCEKDNILKAINSVTKAVAVRTTMPILEGILIQTNDNEVKFTTYDLEMGIEYIINEAQIIEQGATVVNSIMFSEIIRKLPDSDIKITLNENNLLVIECEGSLYKLATMNPEEFPELPRIDVENSIELEQKTLKEMIRKTIFAVSTEENRPIFTGCLFEIKNNRLNVVAVDGFRLAWKTKMLQQQVNDFAAVIPGRSLNEINKIIKNIEPGASASKEEVAQSKDFHVSILILATMLGIIGIYSNLPNIIKTLSLIISYVLLLYKTFINACKLLVKSKIINENALITVSCVGAYLIGEPAEGLMVIILYTIGKILEEKAINNSRKSIKDLINIKQNYANRKENQGVSKVDIDEIKIDDILIVKKGERIPVDGIIIKGQTKLDESALTGESEFVEVKENNKVLSGSINIENVIEIKVTNLFEDSTVAKILELVEDATDKKTKRETFVAKAGKIYTPIIFILAILIAIFAPLIFNITYAESIYRGLTFLVISCPCAIAISIPLSYFKAIGRTVT